MKNDKTTVKVNNKSLGFASVLTIVFIALKLIGKISWSWIWVLCPLWIDFLLTVLIIIGVVLFFKR